MEESHTIELGPEWAWYGGLSRSKMLLGVLRLMPTAVLCCVCWWYQCLANDPKYAFGMPSAWNTEDNIWVESWTGRRGVIYSCAVHIFALLYDTLFLLLNKPFSYKRKSSVLALVLVWVKYNIVRHSNPEQQTTPWLCFCIKNYI